MLTMNVHSKEIVREFYKNNLPILPPDAKWRQFKYFTWDNRMKVIRDHIRSAKQLQKHLVNLAPKDIYVSNSRWLNPTKLGPKRYNANREGHNLAHTLFLGADFVADIDTKHQHPKTPDAAYNTLVSFYNFMKKEYGFDKFTFIRTGNGFQCWITDFEEKYIRAKTKAEYPHNKRNIYFQLRRKIVNKLEKKNIRIDYPLSYNNFNIFRVWNTVHGNTMSVIQAFDAPFELLNEDNSLKVLSLSDAMPNLGSKRLISYASPSHINQARQMMSTTKTSCCETPLPTGRDLSAEGAQRLGTFNNK